MTIDLVGATADFSDPVVAKGDVGIRVEAFKELFCHERATGQGKTKSLIKNLGGRPAHGCDASQ